MSKEDEEKKEEVITDQRRCGEKMSRRGVEMVRR